MTYKVSQVGLRDHFTEFYILNAEGKADYYPHLLAPSEKATVLVSIVNQERKLMTYRVEVVVKGEVVEKLGPVTLEHGQKWAEKVDFMPAVIESGQRDRQEVEFLLYRDNIAEVYQRLRLYIEVIAP